MSEYLHGSVFPSEETVPYPRAKWERPLPRIPIDTFNASCIPAGVRLEFIVRGKSLRIGFSLVQSTAQLKAFIALNRQLRPGFRQGFELWDDSQLLNFAEPAEGELSVDLALPPGENKLRLYLPELLPLRLESIEIEQGIIKPADRGPRWLAYGDSITEGWSTSYAGCNWANTLARKLDADLINVGYGGSARGEIAIAEQIAELEADIISISYGTNCWSRVVHSRGMFVEGLKAFVDIIRHTQPKVPIVAISPLIRPDAEKQPNVLGANLADLRSIFEKHFKQRIEQGDNNLQLIAGFDLIGEGDLVDGIHPGNEGHQRIAEALHAPFASIL